MLADDILFIDAEAMVVNKPAGLPVDAPRDGALAVVNHLDSLRFGFMRQPEIVHRLDRDTSGCLLLARNPKAHRRFGAAFEAGLVEKVYLAVVAGVPAAEGGVIDLPLAKVSTAADGWRIVHDARRGKPARTRWERIAVADGQALIRFMPETGRTHQLRVHAREGLGFPIVGDRVYGVPRRDGRMLLHAAALTLPRAGKPPVHATAPLPAGFEAYAHALPPPVPADAGG